MSKPKYDVRRITQEAFDKWLEGEAWANGGFRSPLQNRLMDAALVPEPPTSAELEEQLVEQVLESVRVHGVADHYRGREYSVCEYKTPILKTANEIFVARAREAREHDDE